MPLDAARAPANFRSATTESDPRHSSSGTVVGGCCVVEDMTRTLRRGSDSADAPET